MEIVLTWIDPNVPLNWTALPINILDLNNTLVWTMNLHLNNPAGSQVYVYPQRTVRVHSPGPVIRGTAVVSQFADTYSVNCDNMSLLDFPFDTQSCSMEFTYSDVGNSQVNFLPSAVYVPSEFGNDEWIWVGTPVQLSGNYSLGGYGIFPGFEIMFTFKRSSSYYITNIIVPTIILQAVGALTFFLPSDESEKILLGATLILAMYVMQQVLSNLIPQFSNGGNPHIIEATMAGFWMLAFSLFESVIVQTMRIVGPDIPVCISYILGKHSTSEETDSNVRLQGVSSNHKNSLSHNEASPIAADPINSNLLLRSSHENGKVLRDIRQIVLEKRAERKKRRRKMEAAEKREANWRIFEYAVNMVSLVIYVVTVVYFFGHVLWIGDA